VTAREVLGQIEALGGTLALNPPDRIRYRLPVPPPPALLDSIRQFKPELLRLLGQPPADPCAACGGRYWWRLRTADAWRCGTCQPDPRAHRLRGIGLEVLAGRSIALAPPAGDLGEPGYWVRTPAGLWAEVVLYEASGAEVLVRTLKGERLAWFRPEQLIGEDDSLVSGPYTG